MKLIRRRRNAYALSLAAGICLAAWLGMAFMSEAVFVFGAISLISLVLLVRQSRLLYLRLVQHILGKHGREL
jgi:hypothetical protein